MDYAFIIVLIIALCCASGIIGYIIGLQKGFYETKILVEDTKKDLNFLNKLTSGGKPEDRDFI